MCIYTTQCIILEYCNCIVFYSRVFAVFYLQVTQVKQAVLSNVAHGTFAFRWLKEWRHLWLWQTPSGIFTVGSDPPPQSNTNTRPEQAWALSLQMSTLLNFIELWINQTRKSQIPVMQFYPGDEIRSKRHLVIGGKVSICHPRGLSCQSWILNAAKLNSTVSCNLHPRWFEND